MKQELVGLVAGAAELRNENPIPREYIEDALKRIESGEFSVERYPTGMPGLKEVFDIAKKLFNDAVSN